LGAVRTKTSLDPGLNEMAICRIAVLNEAPYEWLAHSPLARAGGISKEVLEALVETPAKGQKADVFSEKQWAVLRYTDIMTKDVKVPDEVFGNLRSHFSDQEVLEITAVVATYNMVSRFLVALDVGEKNSADIASIATSR